MSTITIAPYRLNLDGSVSATGTAASAIAPQWSEVRGESGAGSVVFQNDDPRLASLANDGRDLWQVQLDGIPAGLWYSDPVEKVGIATKEYPDEQTTLSGPGALALLDVRLYPFGRVDGLPKQLDRFFGWTTQNYDISGYPAAKVVADVAFAKTDWPEPWADDFPLDICKIIWADNPLGNGSTFLSADEGTCRFWYDFSVTDEGIYRVFVTSDNTAKVWVDSVLIEECQTFTSTQTADFSMSAGSHRLAIEGHNGAFIPGLDSGPGGIALAMYKVTLAGLVLILYTFDGFSVQAYEDDPPGVTVGYVLGLYLDEAATRGCVGALQLARTFDDVNDSNGNPWDEITDVAYPVNASGLDFLRMITATYADLRVDPDLSAGLTLHAYRIGEMGASTGVTYARASNVTVQNHKRENRPTNAILTETTERWLEVTDPTAIAAHGRWESGLDVGSPASMAEAERLTQSDLDRFKNPREEIQLGIEPGVGEVPGVDVLTGDLAVVTDSTGASADEVMVAWTVTQDDTNRRAVFTASFRDVVADDQERLIRMAQTR